MKKITLSIGLVAAILSTKAQDTTCTYFKGEEVYEFNYQTDEILNVTTQETRFFTIDVKDREILCLDLSDDKKRIRKVIIVYPDGDSTTRILDSNHEIYYSPVGPITVKVGKPKLMIKL